MTSWLIRRFIRTPENTQDQAVRKQYGTLGSTVGMALNLLLSLGKILLGLITASLAVMADGVNNLSDAGGSLISLISVRMAQKPLDEEHPFGHGRIEYLGALAISLLTAFFGLELLKESVGNILSPGDTSFSWLTSVLLLISILIKLWMARFYRILGKKADQPALLAASRDSLSDALATSAVALSTVLTLLFSWRVDGYMGALVSLLILKGAWDEIHETVTRLLGGKPNRETGHRIVEMLLRYDGILGVHDLVLHDYGPGRSMASVHAEVAAESDLTAIHEVIDTAEREISRELGLRICIHLDPILTHDEKTETAKAQMTAYLSSLHPPLRLHDFRRVPGDKNINLVFDVLLPPGVRETRELKDGISAYAHALDARYRCVVQFDQDYFGYGADK